MQNFFFYSPDISFQNQTSTNEKRYELTCLSFMMKKHSDSGVFVKSAGNSTHLNTKSILTYFLWLTNSVLSHTQQRLKAFWLLIFVLSAWLCISSNNRCSHCCTNGLEVAVRVHMNSRHCCVSLIYSRHSSDSNVQDHTAVIYKLYQSGSFHLKTMIFFYLNEKFP